jgi:hypothetical protein
VSSRAIGDPIINAYGHMQEAKRFERCGFAAAISMIRTGAGFLMVIYYAHLHLYIIDITYFLCLAESQSG